MRRLVGALIVFAAALSGGTALGAACTCQPPGTPTNFYVDMTSGSDANDGSTAHKWLTIDHARASVQSLLPTLNGDLVVNVSGGTQWDAALAFSDADGVPAPLPWKVRYECASLDACKLRGGVQLNTAACVVFSGSIYRCPYSSAAVITTLWENGVRAYAGRWPAMVPNVSLPMAQQPYLSSAGVNGSQTVLQYSPGDLSPAGWDLNSASVVIWSGVVNWLQDAIPIASVNTGSRQITLVQPTFLAIGTGSRYYVQNTGVSAVVGPGQFYHDQTNGQLYYWPRATPITSQTIVIPTQDRVLQVVGSSSSSPARNLVFKNFDIQFTKPPAVFQADNSASTSSARVNGAVFMQNARDVRLSRVQVSNTSLSGFYLHSANRGVQIDNSWAHNTGLYGFLVENNPFISITPNIGNVLVDNYLFNVRSSNAGELYEGGSAAYLINACATTVDHFDFYNATRTGIEFRGDTWAYAYNNSFRRGKIHEVVQDSSDIGGIYTAETNNAAGNTWDQITITNVTNGALVSGVPPKGVYTDIVGGNQTMTNINVGTTDGGPYFDNSMFGGGNPGTNRSWDVGFDPTKMDPSIGTTADFPWP